MMKMSRWLRSPLLFHHLLMKRRVRVMAGIVISIVRFRAGHPASVVVAGLGLRQGREPERYINIIGNDAEVVP